MLDVRPPYGGDWIVGLGRICALDEADVPNRVHRVDRLDEDADGVFALAACAGQDGQIVRGAGLGFDGPTEADAAFAGPAHRILTGRVARPDPAMSREDVPDRDLKRPAGPAVGVEPRNDIQGLLARIEILDAPEVGHPEQVV